MFLSNVVQKSNIIIRLGRKVMPGPSGGRPWIADEGRTSKEYDAQNSWTSKGEKRA